MPRNRPKTDLDVIVEIHEELEKLLDDPKWDLAEYVGSDPENLRAFAMDMVEKFHKSQPLVILSNKQLASLFLSGWLMGTGYERRRMNKHW